MPQTHPLEPEVVTGNGFRLRGRVFRFDPPFAAPPALSVRLVLEPVGGPWLVWEANGQDAQSGRAEERSGEVQPDSSTWWLQLVQAHGAPPPDASARG